MQAPPQPATTSAPPDPPAMDPHIERLKVAISEKNSCSGTLLLDPQDFILYYGEDHSARRLDFAKASEADLSDLSRACDAATFGLGDQDVLDETYRKAGKMDVTQFASTFSLADSGLIDIVRSELLEGRNDRKMIKAELYKLNVYSPGAFFKVHKDTPRSEDMFGSLVVIFPTRHEGGKLLLRHGQDESEFDSAKAIAERASLGVAYVAFFSDVEHEVTTVTAGYRVTLTYNLYFGSGNEDEVPSIGLGIAVVPSNESKFRTALTELLSTDTFMAEGGKLGFGLSHQYAFSRNYNSAVTSKERNSRLTRSNNHRALERLVHRLKGSDATIFRVCQELSLDAYLRVVYKTRYCLMMADHVIDLANYEVDDVESSLREAGAVVLERYPSPWDAYRDVKNPEKIEKVKWVTKLTPFNKLRTEYIAHGNQADLAYMYADISMVVDVGKFGERDTKTAAEAARADKEAKVARKRVELEAKRAELEALRQKA